MKMTLSRQLRLQIDARHRDKRRHDGNDERN
jgi:hypothetical protein